MNTRFRTHHYQRLDNRGHIAPNEIRVSSKGRIGNYVRYATYIIFERSFDLLRVRGIGAASLIAEEVARALSRRFPSLKRMTVSHDIELPYTEPGYRGVRLLEMREITLMIPRGNLRSEQTCQDTPAKPIKSKSSEGD